MKNTIEQKVTCIPKNVNVSKDGGEEGRGRPRNQSRDVTT